MADVRTQLEEFEAAYPLLDWSETISCDVPAGWLAPVRALCAQLSARSNPDARIQIAQIKDKFGGLRFYLWKLNGAEGAYQLIRECEEVCAKTCETCGAPGESRSRGTWFYTSCAEHVRP